MNSHAFSRWLGAISGSVIVVVACLVAITAMPSLADTGLSADQTGGVVTAREIERDLTGPATPEEAHQDGAQDEVTVYITRTGKKYHRGNCRYVSNSRIPISLNEARQNYAPCSVCRPPQ